MHTNFCLFMPLYDYLGGTVDKNSDKLHAAVRRGTFVNCSARATCSFLSNCEIAGVDFASIPGRTLSHDSVYVAGRTDKPDFVFLAHGTELLSTFHLPFGIASFAAHPYAPKWYLWPLWPLTVPVLLLLWLFGQPFAADKHTLGRLRMQTWVIPRFGFQVGCLRRNFSVFVLACALLTNSSICSILFLLRSGESTG